MPDPDVILKKGRADVVGRLGVTTDIDEEPSVSVDPGEGTLTVGPDESGKRTQLSPEIVRTLLVRPEELSVGGGEEFQNEGRLRINRGGDQDFDPLAGVDIKGGLKTNSSESPAEIILSDIDRQSRIPKLRLRPESLTMEGGEVSGPDRIESTSSMRVGSADSSGASRNLSKDDGSEQDDEYEYHGGEFTVAGDSGTEGEADTRAAIRGAPEDRDGAGASLFHDDGLRTVDLDAGAGRLTLGGHRGGGITSATSGENGVVTLADGAGSFFHVTAEDGMISIELAGSGPLLEIDTNDEKIRTKYEIEAGVL